VPRIVSTKPLHKAGLARVAILAEPRIPSTAGGVSRGDQFVVSAELGEFPGRGGDGYNHLNLAEAVSTGLDIRRQLAVGALQIKERHVVVARGFNWAGLGCNRWNVPGEVGVNQTFVRPALQPDSRVGAAFKKDSFRISRKRLDIASQHSNGGVPGLLPGGVVRGKARRLGRRF